VGCYIWYSEEGPGWAAAPPSSLLAVPNITAVYNGQYTNFIDYNYSMWHYNYLCTKMVKNYTIQKEITE